MCSLSRLTDRANRAVPGRLLTDVSLSGRSIGPARTGSVMVTCPVTRACVRQHDTVRYPPENSTRFLPRTGEASMFSNVPGSGRRSVSVWTFSDHVCTSTPGNQSDAPVVDVWYETSGRPSPITPSQPLHLAVPRRLGWLCGSSLFLESIWAGADVPLY